MFVLSCVRVFEILRLVDLERRFQFVASLVVLGNIGLKLRVHQFDLNFKLIYYVGHRWIRMPERTPWIQKVHADAVWVQVSATSDLSGHGHGAPS